MNDQTLATIIRSFEEAIAEDRLFAASEQAFFELIRYYQREDFHTQALEAAEEACRQYPDNTGFYLLKAQVLMDMHREIQAFHVLTQAWNIDPVSPQIALLKAEALTCMTHYDEALEILEEIKIAANDALMADVFTAEALVYEHMGEYDRMFDALKAAIARVPSHTTALERMSVCIDLTRRYEEGILLYQSLIDQDPFSFMAWYHLGHAQASTGAYDQAIRSYEFAYLINEDFEPAYFDCAELCFESGNTTKALQCYLEIMERFETSAELLFQIGRCYDLQGKIMQALHYYAEAAKLDPLDAEMYFFMGNGYLAVGKAQKAVTFLQKALYLDDSREDYHFALANGYQQMGAYDKACIHFEEALDIAPDNHSLLLGYLRFLLQSNQATRALELISGYADWHDCEESGLIFARIACLLATGSKAEAIYRMGEALEMFPDDEEDLWEWAPELKQIRIQYSTVN